MARKQDNPDRGRKLEFRNGRPEPVEEDEDELEEELEDGDGGDG